MTPVPLDLPLRPSEAAQLGNLILDHAERKPLSDDLRNRLAARAAVMQLETIRPFFGSLDRDPVHPSSYYLAVDGAHGEPLLLHLAVAAAPTSSIFYKALLIGRTRRANGPEMVINAVPFGTGDRENVERFATRIDTTFLPKPQGSRVALAVTPTRDGNILPAAFEAFRAILKRTGKNVAAVDVALDGPPAEEGYAAALWSAIRGGWRDGFSAIAAIRTGSGTLDAARESIRGAAAFSTFRLEAAELLGEDLKAAREPFESRFAPAERAWILEEFVREFDLAGRRFAFAAEEVERLAVKFGRALQAVEQLHEFIRQTRSAQKAGKSFDLELSLEGSASATTPAELAFCLHWLRARGHAAQAVAPRLPSQRMANGEVQELAAVARHYQCAISIRALAGHDAEDLEGLARATLGRLVLRIDGELAQRAGYLNFVAGHLVG